jgi:uncharacterized protein (DUF305 family)
VERVAGLTLGVLLTVIAGCATSPRGVDRAGNADPEAPQATADAHVSETHPDVRFMQQMIHHHAQALEMTRLVPARTPHEGLRLLAERIEVSQRDEIQQMQHWLRDRGHEAPAPDPHRGHGSAHHHAAMSGMLTHEQLTRLEAARGAEFERLFLEFMILHHQGALTMVAELFAGRGAAQDSEAFHLASEIESDQRLEIARMQQLLATFLADQ